MFHRKESTEDTLKSVVDTTLVILGGVGAAVAAGVTTYFQLRKVA